MSLRIRENHSGEALAQFEENYSADAYSLASRLDWIRAPIQLHQGSMDEAVPLKWSDELNQKLKDAGKRVSYYTYTGENYNFQNGGWQTAVERTLGFML